MGRSKRNTRNKRSTLNKHHKRITRSRRLKGGEAFPMSEQSKQELAEFANQDPEAVEKYEASLHRDNVEAAAEINAKNAPSLKEGGHILSWIA